MKRAVVLLTVFLLLFTFGCLEKKERNPPLISVSVDGEEGENGWYTGSLTVSINASDNESTVKELKYRVNGDMWKDYRMPVHLTKDGFYFIECYAKDGNGNEAFYNATLKIDATEPTINFTDFEEGYVYWRGKKAPPLRIPRDTMIIGDYTFTVNAQDGLSGCKKVEFYLGGTLVHEDSEPPYEWELERTFGVYNISAVAYDYAGNYNEIMVEEVQIFNL